MRAILFGSIGTIADTSEIQRTSYNAAFARHGLDWHWDRSSYRAMLATNGGTPRIAAFARARGEAADAAAVHATKEDLFHDALRSGAVEPRPGVLETIMHARDAGIGTALVTTTSPATVDALLGALAPALGHAHFDVITDATHAPHPKPAGDIYAFALDALGTPAPECVAIEDNVGGARAARTAGLPCVAFPNANTTGHDFGDCTRLRTIDIAALRAAAMAHSGHAGARGTGGGGNDE